MNRKIIFIGLVPILLLVIGILFWVFRSGPEKSVEEEQKPSQEFVKTTPLPLKKSIVFENKEKGFSITMPDAWESRPESHADIVIYKKNTNCKISAKILEFEKRTPREIVDDFLSDYTDVGGIRSPIIEDVIIGTSAGILFQAEASELSEETAKIGLAYVSVKGKTYEVLTTCPESIEEAVKNTTFSF